MLKGVHYDVDSMHGIEYVQSTYSAEHVSTYPMTQSEADPHIDGIVSLSLCHLIRLDKIQMLKSDCFLLSCDIMDLKMT
jgi:hypothetical protein